MKLNAIKQITGIIRIETGMHIGAGNESTQIGGVDTPIIRLVKDNNPYIPGSSIKGKLRSIYELNTGTFDQNTGKTHSYKESCENGCMVCRLFGAAASDNAKIGPGRLIIRDSVIATEDAITKRVDQLSTGLPYTEDKAETAINRITGAAQRGSLRKTERVPAGVAFKLDMSLRVMDIDDEEKILGELKKAMQLLERDALGGSTSRGYGKIKFENVTIDGQPFMGV